MVKNGQLKMFKLAQYPLPSMDLITPDPGSKCKLIPNYSDRTVMGLVYIVLDLLLNSPPFVLFCPSLGIFFSLCLRSTAHRLQPSARFKFSNLYREKQWGWWQVLLNAEMSN